MRTRLPLVASAIPVLGLVLGLVLGTGVAGAQSMATSGAAPSAGTLGDGISLGSSLVLHLGIGAELRYDSNVFFESANTTQGLALRLTPHFTLGSRPVGQKVLFRMGAGLDYREWLVSSTGQRPPRQLNADASVGVTILPTGPVTTELYDNFIRSSQMQYQVSTTNYDRDINELGIRLRIKPGGGRLELDLSYAFGVDFWENRAQQLFDNYYHHSNLRLLYKFLPKTSVYLMADNIVYQYQRTATPAEAAQRPDGYPLRVVAGLNGLLTAKLTFDLYGGYVNGFYKTGPSPSTGTAGLTLTWRPLALTGVALAYRHDAENTLLGVYANLDNVSVALSQQIWRFTGYLRLAYQNTRYFGITPATGIVKLNGAPTTTRTDNSFALNARVDFFTYHNWLALSVGYDFTLLRSDTTIGGGVGSSGPIVPVSFDKHEVYLGLSLRY